MSDRIGYVVIEYSQASGLPGLTIAADLYEHRDDAEHALQVEREATARTGRRERHVIAEVIEMEEGTDDREP